jgi:hypothetical protein
MAQAVKRSSRMASGASILQLTSRSKRTAAVLFFSHVYLGNGLSIDPGEYQLSNGHTTAIGKIQKNTQGNGKVF